MIDSLQVETLYDSILTGIYILDRNGNYVYANGAFLRLVCCSKDDLKALNEFKLEEAGHLSESTAIKAFEQRRRVTLLDRITSPDGVQQHFVVTATPIFDGSGEIEYMLVEQAPISMLEQYLGSAAVVDINHQVNGFPVGDSQKATEVIAASPEMRGVLEVADRVASLDCTVLLTGETGTGKDVLAHYIHDHSPRSTKKMQILNCAALPENLLESELFGYVKGAYTGALQSGKEGLIQQAHNGTLFLDEINSMPLSVQGKLLRVLETKQVKRLGALKEEQIDFRLLAATNQDLKACVEAGTFRADLFYRLSVVPIEIPPLRERRGDIIPLTMKFIEHYCRRYNRTKMPTVDVLQSLMMYNWPGNVRELKNVIERLIVTSSPSTLEISQLPPHILTGDRANRISVSQNAPLRWESLLASAPEQFSLKTYMDACEAEIIEGCIERYGSTRKAAEVLKTDQSTIVRKRAKYKNC